MLRAASADALPAFPVWQALSARHLHRAAPLLPWPYTAVQLPDEQTAAAAVKAARVTISGVVPVLGSILSDATIGIPFSVLILKNYFASIPRELEEAAYMDGCNRFTGFFRVLIPVAKPGVMVCAIFSFLYAWGDLAYGMTFILDQEKRPITAGIFNFMGKYGTKWSYLTAFAVVTIIPVALIFIFMQKYIISGMTSGAVKG